jgi:hypothetical protein
LRTMDRRHIRRTNPKGEPLDNQDTKEKAS